METYVITKAFPGHKPGAEAQFDPADVESYVKDGSLVKKDAAASAEVETELDATVDAMADRFLAKFAKTVNAKSKSAPFNMSAVDGLNNHAEVKEEGSAGEILQAIGWASAASFGSFYQKGIDLLTNKYGANGFGAVTHSKSFDRDFSASTRMDGGGGNQAKSKAVQQESQGTAGGFAVAPQFAETFFELLYPKSTLISEVVRRTVTGLDYYEPTWDYSLGGSGKDPYLAGMNGGWLPENAPFNLTTAAMNQFHLKMNLFGAINQVTRQLLYDAPRLQSVLMEKFAQVAAFYLTAAIFSGDGEGKPKGFTLAPCASATNRTGSPTVGDLLNDLASVFAKRLTDEGSTSRLFWMISPSFEKQLILLTDKSSKVVFLPNFPGTSGGPATARVPMLLFGAWPVLGFMGLDILLVWWLFKRSYLDARRSETLVLTEFANKAK